MMLLTLLATCALTAGTTFTPPPGWQVVRITAEVVSVSWAEAPQQPCDVSAMTPGTLSGGGCLSAQQQFRITAPTVTVQLRSTQPLGHATDGLTQAEASGLLDKPECQITVGSEDTTHDQ